MSPEANPENFSCNCSIFSILSEDNIPTLASGNKFLHSSATFSTPGPTALSFPSVLHFGQFEGISMLSPH